jgi:hypothetical protein
LSSPARIAQIRFFNNYDFEREEERIVIIPEASGLVVKIASGLIKLTHRADLVLAEKAAVTGPLTLIQPDMVLAPPPEKMIPALRLLLADTEDEDLDPLGLDRAEIKDLVKPGASPDQPELLFFMEKYLPEQAMARTIDLNSSVMKAVAKARPEWKLDDPEIRAAAFYVSPGQDIRKKGYTWRLALTVVDALAEFGAENSVLFTRDEKLQSIVGAVLMRFGEADLQTADSWSGLVRSTLTATLNGALDAREHFEIEKRWVESLLDALQKARESVPEAKRDEFLLGLVEGRGYPILVGEVLKTAAIRLSADDAEAFDKIAADVLMAAASHFQKGSQFKDYLKEHWGDLLRTGLKGLAEHGRVLLGNESPLVQEVLLGVMEKLSDTPNHKFITTGMLAELVDAAVSAVVAKPELITASAGNEWLAVLVRSVASTVSDQGVRDTFDREGVEKIIRGALASFAEHPELIIDEPGLPQKLLRDVLTNVSIAERLTAEALASSALQGALGAISDRPDLIKMGYPRIIASLAGKVANLVNDKSLSQVQGSDILGALTESLVENPQLFLKLEKRLSGLILDTIIKVSKGSNGGLITGITLVEVARSVANALAVSGKGALSDHTTNELIQQLESVLDAGLERADKELGNRLGLSSLPQVLGELVSSWARGEIAEIDPGNKNFKSLFVELAEMANAA